MVAGQAGFVSAKDVDALRSSLLQHGRVEVGCFPAGRDPDVVKGGIRPGLAFPGGSGGPLLFGSHDESVLEAQIHEGAEGFFIGKCGVIEIGVKVADDDDFVPVGVEVVLFQIGFEIRDGIQAFLVIF